MTLSTLDEVPALVVIDLQRGIAAGRETTPHALSDVIARSARVGVIFPKIGETATTAEVLAALNTATAGV